MIYIKWLLHQFYGLQKKWFTCSCLVFLLLFSCLGVYTWYIPVDPNHPEVTTVYPRNYIYVNENPKPVAYVEDRQHPSLNCDGHPFAIWCLFSICVYIFIGPWIVFNYMERNEIFGYRWEILNRENRLILLYFNGFKEYYRKDS